MRRFDSVPRLSSELPLESEICEAGKLANSSKISSTLKRIFKESSYSGLLSLTRLTLA